MATVTTYKSRTLEDLAKSVTEDIRAAFALVSSVMVKGEPEYIRQLVASVATANEADAMVIVGGTGFGPFDSTCEAIDGLVERRIEGFGEAFRQLLRDEFAVGPVALLARATAGVYSQCVVYALSGQPSQVRRAARDAHRADAARRHRARHRPHARARRPVGAGLDHGRRSDLVSREGEHVGDLRRPARERDEPVEAQRVAPARRHPLEGLEKRSSMG